MIKQLSVALLVGTFAVAGCQNMDKRDVGTGLGAVAGGLIGHQFGEGTGRTAATLVGAVIGGYIGGRVGSSMDNADRRHIASTLEHNRSGQTHAWVNPDSGNHYAVTPKPAYTNASGQHCRHFLQSGNIDGQVERLNGTACRQSDGSWRIVSAQ